MVHQTRQLVAATMHPKDLSIKDYSYPLPATRIANYPLAQRDASKLLIYKDGSIGEDLYKNIANHIPAHSLLIFNNTRVVEARLLFQKPTGGVIEIFCLEPHDQYPDISTAMLQTNKVWWQCLVGGASKWKHGQVLEKKTVIDNKEIILKAAYVEKKKENFIIELSWSPSSLTFAEVLHHTGAVPLPPYIKRAAELSDAERYQTIYAHLEGSVAAPTAGLHFTEQVFSELKKKNIKTDFLALHVGAGTFKPVKSDTMETHEMHAEFIDVSKKTIENILTQIHNPIIAIGTTSLRTMESLYWLGVKQSIVESRESIAGSQLTELSQWEVYEELAGMDIKPEMALRALLQWMEENNMDRLIAKTRIIIAPGYEFKIADALITNFHQPQSTLLLLVAALIGNEWKKVYDYALDHEFRFLSYGDGCLLWSYRLTVPV